MRGVTLGGSEERLPSDRLCRVVRASEESLPRFYLEVEKAGAQGGGVVWKKREKSY